ncbi:hypothetical protein J7E41_13425 [Pseudomonas fluorescens]|nr:hypothetical protein [Pseudomonas fluorescens]
MNDPLKSASPPITGHKKAPDLPRLLMAFKLTQSSFETGDVRGLYPGNAAAYAKACSREPKDANRSSRVHTRQGPLLTCTIS